MMSYPDSQWNYGPSFESGEHPSEAWNSEN